MPTLTLKKSFPENIPEDIINNTFDHHNPHDSDQGIQFEPESNDTTSPDLLSTVKIIPIPLQGKVTHLGVLKSFTGHRGRPGKRGGSLPRNLEFKPPPMPKEFIGSVTLAKSQARLAERAKIMEDTYGVKFAHTGTNPLGVAEGKKLGVPGMGIPRAIYEESDPISDPIKRAKIQEAYDKYATGPGKSGYLTFTTVKFATGLPFKEVFGVFSYLRSKDPELVSFTVDRSGKNVAAKIHKPKTFKSFTGHLGRPGKQGGSLPKGNNYSKVIYLRKKPDYAGLISQAKFPNGAIHSIYDGEKQGMDTSSGRWQLLCEKHGTIISNKSLTLAKHHLSDIGWCEECYSELQNVTTKQHTGAMVAFDISNDPFGKIAGSDAHVTLIYLGEADQLIAEPLYEVLADFAKNHMPISGTFTGYALLTAPKDSPDGSAVVVLFDSPDLLAFRQTLLHKIAIVLPDVLNQEHGFTAHMTLTYTKDANVNFPTDYVPVPKTFDKITLYWGDKKTDFVLTGTVIEKQHMVGTFRKEITTIVIDTEENDDWMKSLPGYKDEVKLSEDIANAGNRSA